MAENDDALPDTPSPTVRRPQRAAWVLTGLGVLGGGVLLGLVLFNPPPNGDARDPGVSAQAEGPNPRLFVGWSKPDVALFITGEMHGYLQPCGCSEPQYGGLVRRYNFLQTLKKAGWPVVAVDLGDIAKERGGRQNLWKYVTAMEALKAMNYTAIGIGKNEFQLGLLDGLAEFVLQNNPVPRVLAANLEGRKKGEVFDGLVQGWEVAKQPASPRVGVFSLVAPSVAKTVKDPFVKFTVGTDGKYDNATVIRKSLTELKAQKADFSVLLYVGNATEAKKCAEFCQQFAAPKFALPAVRAIVCLSDDPEPPFAPEVVGDVQVVWVGQKGKYVGVLGGYRKGQAWTWKYQPVKIGPDYDTKPADKKAHPVMALMEAYAVKVKNAKLVEQFIQVDHPVQQAFPGVKPKYVGSKRCQECHPSATAVWKKVHLVNGHKLSHSLAYKTLQEAKDPSERQFDPECVACHVVGFGKTGGFTDPFNTSRLKDVGCESCHGPCGEHVKAPFDGKWYPHINPQRAGAEERKLAAQKIKGTLDPTAAKRLGELNARRMNGLDRFCQSCHDIENDVHWKFNERWPKIIHMTPAKERQGRNRPTAQAPDAPPQPEIQPGTTKKE